MRTQAPFTSFHLLFRHWSHLRGEVSQLPQPAGQRVHVPAASLRRQPHLHDEHCGPGRGAERAGLGAAAQVRQPALRPPALPKGVVCGWPRPPCWPRASCPAGLSKAALTLEASSLQDQQPGCWQRAQRPFFTPQPSARCGGGHEGGARFRAACMGAGGGPQESSGQPSPRPASPACPPCRSLTLVVGGTPGAGHPAHLALAVVAVGEARRLAGNAGGARLVPPPAAIGAHGGVLAAVDAAARGGRSKGGTGRRVKDAAGPAAGERHGGGGIWSGRGGGHARPPRAAHAPAPAPSPAGAVTHQPSDLQPTHFLVRGFRWYEPHLVHSPLPSLPAAGRRGRGGGELGDWVAAPGPGKACKGGAAVLPPWSNHRPPAPAPRTCGAVLAGGAGGAAVADAVGPQIHSIRKLVVIAQGGHGGAVTVAGRHEAPLVLAAARLAAHTCARAGQAVRGAARPCVVIVPVRLALQAPAVLGGCRQGGGPQRAAGEAAAAAAASGSRSSLEARSLGVGGIALLAAVLALGAGRGGACGRAKGKGCDGLHACAHSQLAAAAAGGRGAGAGASRAPRRHSTAQSAPSTRVAQRAAASSRMTRCRSEFVQAGGGVAARLAAR